MRMKRILAVIAASAAFMSTVPVCFPASAVVGEVIADNFEITPYCAYLDGVVRFNSGRNNYERFASPIYSHLYENTDGTLTRVDCVDGIVHVEQYKGAKLIDSQEIPGELSFFGGFYSGQTGNYLVYGQNNPYENDTTEVIRVVKYTKSWKRIGTASLYGENTQYPFEAGSLRMTEASGRLYVYTSHKMYRAADDGISHQANLTMVVDENMMMVVDKYTRYYQKDEGYVSHSFNQFICTDGNKIYRADHGDSFPRGIYASRCNVGDEVKNVAYGTVMSFPGEIGNNSTGVTLGGMELGSDNCLIAGNTVDHAACPNDDYEGQKNIFVVSYKKGDFGETSVKYLTNYANDADITVKTPHLVKIGYDKFAVMWEEYHPDEDRWLSKYAVCDQNGDMKGRPITLKASLSDCKPILCLDGVIRWYVSDDDHVRLFGVDPENLSRFEKEEPVSEIEAYQKVLDDYKNSADYVSRTENKNNCSMYDLADVNGDGTPELFISQGTEKQSGCRVFTFDGFNTIELTRYADLNKVGSYGEVYTSEGSSYILSLNSTDTESVLNVYEMRDNALWNKATFSDNGKDPNSAEKYYRINGKDVSEEEYTEEIHKYAPPRPVETGRRFWFDKKVADAVNAIPKYTLGDVNSDGSVDSSDASLVLAEYAAISTGAATTLTDIQGKAADVNTDGSVDSTDASLILAFYSHVSTGGKFTDMKTWLENDQP